MNRHEVVIPGLHGEETEVRLDKEVICLTVRVRETLPPCREIEVTMKHNRTTALALANILLAWANELPLSEWST